MISLRSAVDEMLERLRLAPDWSRVAFWTILTTACLLVSTSAIFSATWGDWRTHLLGVEYQFVWDPGGAYIGTGLTFFDSRYSAPGTDWAGHPGLPLMFLIHVLAKGMYLVSSLGESDASFTSWAAVNLDRIAAAARLMITGLHLLSFCVLHRFARRLTRDENIARVAVVTYATNFFVLFYLSNISVEPLLVVSTLLAFLLLARAADRVERGRISDACGWSTLAAIACTGAFYSKILIAAPIVLLAPLYLGVEGVVRRRRSSVSVARALLPFAACVISLAALLPLVGLKVNWPQFFEYWSHVEPVRDGLDVRGLVADRDATNVVGSLLTGFGDRLASLFDASTWAIGFGKRDHAYVAELAINVLAVIGVVVHWLRRRVNRRQLAWLALFCLAIAPAIAFKRMWHYYAIYYALAAVFCAYALHSLFKLVLKRWSSGGRMSLYAGACVLLLHGLSIALVHDARVYDASQYQRWRPYYTALRNLSPDGRIGLVGGPYPAAISGRVVSYMPQDHPIAQALDDRFVRLRRSQEDLESRHVEIVIERPRM